mmetsp:Transcript_18884/g.40682  ORF Transcript_18884/g.40682 Transcript_18884/m.40682 type:complete len:582 (+) Transcript_18884:92-1837(+)|eukprot:CAMPEP_0202913560 /NCGR_PEP_ID=MMETSP1392-20130828/60815_1 /ASSEMBLY_ACC=CAM_ASM_000868 /TAXON_ID=225041 /ORGANISM="Chlamydomonas chlamydogama, Strain SAG 11-48b" /LENGTH=581 /DNA_ID=CAMNT_0049604857 /DNA_START=77 /DNA_END=1822 /DNA_ORIENTATION=-
MASESPSSAPPVDSSVLGNGINALNNNASSLDQAAAPLREEQIQNAVAFLTHPRVKGSPAATKRSFLEKKGLTTAEIEEAFRRVPDEAASASVVSSTQPGSTATPMPSQLGSGLVTYMPSNQQPVEQQGRMQHNPMQSMTQPNMGQGVVALHQQPVLPEQQRVRWTQVVLGIGVVAAGVYTVRSLVLPYCQDLYSRWHASHRARQDELEVRERQVQEAFDAMKAVQEQLVAASQSLAEAARSLKEQAHSSASGPRGREWNRYGDDPSSHLQQELAEIRDAVRGLGPQAAGYNMYNNTYHPGPAPPQGYLGGSSSRPAGGWLGSSAGGNVGGPAASPQPPPSSSYPGASAYGMGENTSADDGGFMSYAQGPSRDNDPGSGHMGSGYHGRAQPDGSGSTGAPASKPTSDEPAYPKSFHEVMEMVSKGITPPNVRTDINDKPPDPSRPFSEPRIKPMSKPWERDTTATASGSTLSSPAASVRDSSNNYAPVPTPTPSGGISMFPQPIQTDAMQYPPLSVLPTNKDGWKPPPPPEPTLATSKSSGGVNNMAAVNAGSVNTSGVGPSQHVDPAGSSTSTTTEAPQA